VRGLLLDKAGIFMKSLSDQVSLKTNDFSPLSRLLMRLTASLHQSGSIPEVSLYCNNLSLGEDVSTQGLDRACDCGTII
jgi:hypothetical protein